METMKKNFYFEHRKEIIAISNEEKADWGVATAMWEMDRKDLPEDFAEQKSAFLNFVYGKRFDDDGNWTVI